MPLTIKRRSNHLKVLQMIFQSVPVVIWGSFLPSVLKYNFSLKVSLLNNFLSSILAFQNDHKAMLGNLTKTITKLNTFIVNTSASFSQSQSCNNHDMMLNRCDARWRCCLCQSYENNSYAFY